MSAPLVVSLGALRRAADRDERGAGRNLAHMNIDDIERRLWRERRDKDAPFPLALAREAGDVEFACWALQYSASGDPANPGAPDFYGRHLAVALVWDALTWLNAAERTDHELTHAHLKDMMADLADNKVAENHFRWIGWLELLEGQARAIEGEYAGRALLAAVWCGQSIVAPAPAKPGDRHYPTPRNLARLGRRCAYSAYDNLMYAWVTANEGFRAAHEVADAAARWDGKRNVLCDLRLQEHDDWLRMQADRSLDAITSRAWKIVMEGELK